MEMLKGRIVPINELNIEQRDEMFTLMDLHYENMTRENFERDMVTKDYSILLENGGHIWGFSTQKIIELKLGNVQTPNLHKDNMQPGDVQVTKIEQVPAEKTVHGVFSGDTIVHKEWWGANQALFPLFAKFFFSYGEAFDHFYWFLISKGYKTYKILPTFFREFYPCCDSETPTHIQAVMDAYAKELYGDEYDKESGIIIYNKIKDTLRPSVADIPSPERIDKHTKFFIDHNPDWKLGNDMVCITDLKRDNLRKGMARRVL